MEADFAVDLEDVPADFFIDDFAAEADLALVAAAAPRPDAAVFGFEDAAFEPEAEPADFAFAAEVFTAGFAEDLADAEPLDAELLDDAEALGAVLDFAADAAPDFELEPLAAVFVF